MPSATIQKSTGFADRAATFMARVVGDDAANINQGSLTSISVRVFDARTGIPVGASASVTIATTVFDTLQTDAFWTKDTTGYNFRHQLVGTNFPDGGKTYRVEYKFTPVSGEAWNVEWDHRTITVFEP